MKIKLLVTLLLLCLTAEYSSASYFPDDNTKISAIQQQVWSFMKYNKHNPSLYTGTVKESIPIYTYKDPDFEIPISINYSSNGYMPNNQASSVGLGWFLAAGGYIIRDIEGVRDDNFGGYENNGFFRNDNINYNNDTDLYFMTSLSRDLELLYYRDYVKETTPDVHTFNFCGHEGQFSFGFKNQVYIYNTNHPQGEYSIDLTNYISKNIYDKQADTEIVITTGDGYKYYFGRPNNMGSIFLYLGTEFNENTLRFEDVNISKNYWVITKIIAPNGRKVIYKYGPQEANYNCQCALDKYRYSESTGWYRTTKEYVCQLQAILIDDFSINFSYTSRTNEKVHENSSSGTQGVPVDFRSINKLSNITVKNGDSIIKECSLNYMYASASDNPVMFLKDIDISGEGKYSMDYYDIDKPFPAHATSNLDHWGYYNHKAGEDISYGSALVTVGIGQDGEEIVTSSNRDPHFESARQGMLKTLLYPTGGFSKFYYEEHKYQCRLTRDALNEYRPYLKYYSNECTAGGARIRRITNYTTVQDSTYKDYIYKYNNQNDGSGILLHFPIYKRTPGNFVTYSTDKTHIEYSDVIEKFSDGSYKKYHFSNYREVPDEIFDYINGYNHYSGVIGKLKPSDNEVAEPSSLAMQRGKIMSEEYYNKDGRLQKRTRYNYNFDEQLPYHPTVKLAWLNWYIYKQFVGNYKLLSVVEETKSTDDNKIILAVEKKFSYNSRGQIVKTYYGDVMDSTVFIVDKPIDKQSIEDKGIIQQNLISLPYRRYTHEKIDNQYCIIEILEYSYILKNNYPYLSEIYRAKIDKPCTSETLISFQLLAKYEYNDLGRVIHVVNNPNTINPQSISYIWGYKGLYPVAELTSSQQSYHLLNIKDIQGLGSCHKTPLESELTPLQSKALRESVQASITTYKFIPFIGMSEIINSQGIKTSYEYNPFGKLYKILDTKGRVLEQYEYSTDK